MMSSTQNTGRASKDRGNKTQNSPHNSKNSSDWHKSPDGTNPKIQPTPEQIRMAQIANDTNKSDDPDVKKKVEQIMELTGKPSDTAIIALHDCDNDPERAVIMLLDGNSVEAEWETKNKKKKNRQQAPKGPADQQQANSSGGSAANHRDGERGPGREQGIASNKENRGERGDRGPRGGDRGPGESKGREDFRNRGPPRLSRGNGRNWRNKENEKNERNLEESRRERLERSQDGRSDRNFEGRGDRNFEGRGERNFENRERSYDGKPRGGRRGGLSRGRGGGNLGMGGGGREPRDMTGGGGGSGGPNNLGGGRVRTFQNRGLREQDSSFPQSIDTWTNSTAEQASSKTNGPSSGMAVGNWSEFQTGEDWSEEDWTEGLTETKVFTPSTNVQASIKSEDSSLGVTLSQSQERTPLFHKQSGDNPSLQQHSNGLLPSPSPPQHLQSQSSQAIKSHPSAIPSSSSSTPMAAQVAAAAAAAAAAAQSHFSFSQYAQQAAESIKAAVGIPSSGMSNSNNSNVLSHSASTPSSASVYSSSLYTSQQQQQVSGVSLSSATSAADQLAHHHQQQQQQHQQQVRATMPSQQQQQQQVQTTQHPHSVSGSVVTLAKQTQGLPPRAKSQRPRIPPPSKIPESAVEMPDDAITTLDVQFGALEFGTDSSPFDYTGISKSGYQDSVSSSGSHLVNNQQPSSTVISHTSSIGTTPLSVSSGGHPKDSVATAYSNLVSQQTVAASVSSQHQSTASHLPKDLSQSSSMVSQQQKVSGADALLLSQSERKNVTQSSYGGQRSSSSSAVDGHYTSGSKQALLVGAVAGGMGGYPGSTSSLPSALDHQGQSGVSSLLVGGVSGQPSSLAVAASFLAATSNHISASATSYGMPTQQQYAGSVAQSTSASYPSSQTGYTSSYTYSTQQAYPGSNSSSHPSKMGSSLSHSVDTQQHSYDPSSVSSLNASLASSASSVGGMNSSNLVSSGLGVLAGSPLSTSSSTNTTSVLKNSLSATKTLPSMPPGVPATAMLGHQYIMSQAATLPFYGLQQTLYTGSYEDMQMLQSRMPTLGYYDMQFPAPASLTTGRDPNMANIAYTDESYLYNLNASPDCSILTDSCCSGAEMKFNRSDSDASAVVTTMSQGQNQNQTHGQTLFNTLPPGYGYYFTGGMMPGSIPHYPPPIFSVPPTNNTHGTSSNTQYQKASPYNSHTYGSGAGTTDLSGSMYNKTHQQMAKPGVPMGASSTPYTSPPFIPVLTHGQHHSTMLHHHMQDSPQANAGNPGGAGSTQRGCAQPMTQAKGPGSSNKQNYPYWNNN